MKVVNIAISPWAKLTTSWLGREHERERKAGVDAAVREPDHDLLEKSATSRREYVYRP